MDRLCDPLLRYMMYLVPCTPRGGPLPLGLTASLGPPRIEGLGHALAGPFLSSLHTHALAEAWGLASGTCHWHLVSPTPRSFLLLWIESPQC